MGFVEAALLIERDAEIMQRVRMAGMSLPVWISPTAWPSSAPGSAPRPARIAFSCRRRSALFMFSTSVRSKRLIY
jgi:hypothetical protein